MKRLLSTAFAAGVALAPLAAAAQTAANAAELAALDAQLPGTLANDPTRIDWASYGENYKAKGVRSAAIPGGGAAQQFAVRRKGDAPYVVAANIPLTVDIAAGDVMTVGFYARTVAAETDDGQGVIGVRFQQNAAPYGGFGDAVVRVGPDWQWHEVSGTATSAIPRAQAIVALQLAGARQTVEIGQAIVVKGAGAILASAAAASPAAAQASAGAAAVGGDALPEPVQGLGRLVSRPGGGDWSHTGKAAAYAERQDASIWLGTARRATVGQGVQNPWDVGITVPLTEAVAAGETLIIAVAAKTVEPGPNGSGQLGLRVQDTAPPYAGFGDAVAKVGSNWQLIRTRATVTEAIPAGRASVALHLAGQAQTIDIGPVYVFKAP